MIGVTVSHEAVSDDIAARQRLFRVARDAFVMRLLDEEAHLAELRRRWREI